MKSKQFILKASSGNVIVSKEVSRLKDRAVVRAFFSRLYRHKAIDKNSYLNERDKLSGSLSRIEGTVVEHWFSNTPGDTSWGSAEKSTYLRGDIRKGIIYGGLIGLALGRCKSGVTIAIGMLVGGISVAIINKLAVKGFELLKEASAKKEQTLQSTPVN